MQGPYDVEFRTMSVSRELTERALDHRRQLDEAKRSETIEPQGASLPSFPWLVLRLLGLALSGRHGVSDDAGARVASTITLASESQSSGASR